MKSRMINLLIIGALATSAVALANKDEPPCNHESLDQAKKLADHEKKDPSEKKESHKHDSHKHK